jgi:hypothetical protein
MNLLYCGQIKILTIPSVFIVGEKVKIQVEICNNSEAIWTSEDVNPCHLSYHITKKSSENYVFDGLRTRLQQPIFPGQSLKDEILIEAPKKTGVYFIYLTLVKEQVAWFERQGFKAAKARIRVK